MKYKILTGVVVVLIAIQFIPYGKNHSNPAVVAEPEWDKSITRTLFFRTCSDCHSNETDWPWYSFVAPVSWLIQHDVDEGREHFNVSVWGIQKKNRGREAAEEVSDGGMPPWIYTAGHSNARLSDREKKDLIKGLRATFNEKKSTQQSGMESSTDD